MTAAILALVGAASCGESPEDEVEKVVQTYLDALVDGDGELACEQLSTRERASVVAGVRRQQDGARDVSCAEAVAAFEPFFTGAELEAVDVQVEGDRATAAGRVPERAAPNQSLEARTLKRYVLRRSDGDWRIEDQTG